MSASYLKSLSLLSMVLLMLMGPIAELSALDNPFLPALKQRDKVVEELNADVSSRRAQISQFNTKADILANQATIRSVSSELYFYEYFQKMMVDNPGLDVADVLELIHIDLSQQPLPNGEHRAISSLQEAQVAKQAFTAGNFATGLDQFIEYAQL